MSDEGFKISWEWEPADSVRTREHRATWARIEIKVGSDFVTLVEDKATGSSRRSIYCPLYPLAEWIAYNWWFLRADTRPSSFLSQDGVLGALQSRPLPSALWEHHSIRASGDGFAWPDLMVIPDEDETRLVWRGDETYSSNRSVRFLARGDFRARSENILKEFELLVTETLTRLAEQGVTDTVLEKEWIAIQDTDPEEAEYCCAAARLGLDPYSDAEVYEQDIIQAAEALDGQLLADFLNAVSPDRIGRALSWISTLNSTLSDRQTTTRSLSVTGVAPIDYGIFQELRADVRRRASNISGPPWNIGYQQARIVREQVVTDSTARLAVDRYVTALTRKAPDLALQALGIDGDNAGPVFVVGQDRPIASTRFTLSRALWHYIWDDSPLFLVTTAHTYRQRIERAFAAELLAPAEGISELLESSPEVASQEELEQIAHRYGVSSMVVEHQVQNRLLAPAT